MQLIRTAAAIAVAPNELMKLSGRDDQLDTRMYRLGTWKVQRPACAGSLSNGALC
jgi:hypothetical protein